MPGHATNNSACPSLHRESELGWKFESMVPNSCDAIPLPHVRKGHNLDFTSADMRRGEPLKCNVLQQKH
eukprot:6343235-Amphidinium_carterae.1